MRDDRSKRLLCFVFRTSRAGTRQSEQVRPVETRPRGPSKSGRERIRTAEPRGTGSLRFNRARLGAIRIQSNSDPITYLCTDDDAGEEN